MSAQTKRPDVRLQQAVQFLRSGDAQACEAACDRLLAADPSAVDAWLLKARVAGDTARLEDARACLEQAAGIAPQDPAVLLALGRCLAALRLEWPAIDALRRGVDLDPGNAPALQHLADLEARVGETAAAAGHLEAVLRIEPANARAHYRLSTLKPATADDPRITRLKALLDHGKHDRRDRSRLAFALGRLLDQSQQFEAAFHWFREANQLRRADSDFDLQREARYVAGAKTHFLPELFAAERPGGFRSELPVFVVGMPRSGSTLVEQVLASHPQVAGAGETMLLPECIAQLPAYMPEGSVMPDAVARIAPEAWTTLGKNYVGRLRDIAAHADRIVDKQLFNYTLVGLIHLLLPGAKIIHCTRNPMATCWSCYTTAFRNDRGFTFSLEDLGNNYHLYQALMQHWDKVIPDAFLEVRYEDVVFDLEKEARRMIEYLGLPWSERCLDYPKTVRAVRTSSDAQVRKPVYQTSLEHWRHYAHLLGPLEHALAGDCPRPR